MLGLAIRCNSVAPWATLDKRAYRNWNQLGYSSADIASTPIFDLDMAPPQPRTRRWIGVLVGIALGVLLGLSPEMNLRYLPDFNGFLFFPALYVAIAIHEAGHLLAGTIVGMPPGALVVGGIVIFKSGERWLIRFDPRCML